MASNIFGSFDSAQGVTVNSTQEVFGKKRFLNPENEFEGVFVQPSIQAGNTTISPTELSYLDGVTSNIQTQLEGFLTVAEANEYYLGRLGEPVSEATLTTFGAVAVQGQLNVAQPATFQMDAIVQQNLSVAGTSTLEGSASITGGSTLQIIDGVNTNTINAQGYTTRNSVQNATHFLNFSDSSATGTGAIQKNALLNCNPSTGNLGCSTLNATSGAFQSTDLDPAPTIVIRDTATTDALWLLPNAGQGTYNHRTVAGDSLIIGANSQNNVSNLTITTYSDTLTGVRITPTTTSIAAGGASSVPQSEVKCEGANVTVTGTLSGALNVTDTNTSATFYPVFVSGSGGQILRADVTTGPFSINPFTQSLNFGTNLKITADQVSIGAEAGLTNQGSNSFALGSLAGSLNQGLSSVAIGASAGENNQGASSIAIGENTANNAQGTLSVAIGYNACTISQGGSSVAIGANSGTTQGGNSVAIGASAGTTQGANSVAIGTAAGAAQDGNNVAIGNGAGSAQGASAVAIGRASGQSSATNTVSLGATAGQAGQLEGGVAIGFAAGKFSQQLHAIAIGTNAGLGVAGTYAQQTNAIAIGNGAAQCTAGSQGASSIAIGRLAASTGQAANSICLNASGVSLAAALSGFFVKPIRIVNASTGLLSLFYDSSTSEVQAAIYPEFWGPTITAATTLTVPLARNYLVSASAAYTITLPAPADVQNAKITFRRSAFASVLSFNSSGGSVMVQITNNNPVNSATMATGQYSTTFVCNGSLWYQIALQ